MSQQQHNDLLSNMLKEKQVLALLRAQLEGRRERECWSYRKFRHLVYNYRTKKEEKKEKREKPQNKYEMLATRVMQYRVRDEIKVRWQKRIKKAKYFRCWEVGHCKWECPNIEVKREKRKSKQMACMVGLQKAQQERRPVHPIWKKIQEYCNKWSMPPEEVLLLKRGQITEEIVVTYVEYEECEGKGCKGTLPMPPLKHQTHSLE